jgi:hypothetical protein
MSKAIKVKLDTLYKASVATEPTPHHYTPVTVEIVSASSDVTIRATTNPDFDGSYNELPAQVEDGAEGMIYECAYARSLQFVSFSCSDSSAEIYVAGLKLEEIGD